MLEIGIPVYNAKETLAKALDSLVAQTKNNFIVCLSIDGDGNSEFYKKMAQEYIRRGLKIRIIDSEENGGPGQKYFILKQKQEIMIQYVLVLFVRKQTKMIMFYHKIWA